jgi:FkbM family methyltransferase
MVSKIKPLPLGRVIPGLRRRFEDWRSRDRWWLGRLVELCGNTAKVDGCTFSLNSPMIDTALKSRFVTGGYERGERAALASELGPSVPVVEMGGCLGVISCLVNRRLARPDRHVVVEAHPDLVKLLGHNRDRNGAQFEILHAAVAYGRDAVEFHEGKNFLAGRLAREKGRSFTVPGVTLSGLVNTREFKRCTLICDIEGAEADLIANDAATLAGRVATLIIEWHEYVTGPSGVAALQRQLDLMGFVLTRETGAVATYQNTRLGHG